MTLTDQLQDIGIDVFDMPQDLRDLDRLTAYMARRFNAERANRFAYPETGSFETRVALSQATEATEYEAAAMSAASSDELCTLNNYRGL